MTEHTDKFNNGDIFSGSKGANSRETKETLRTFNDRFTPVIEGFMNKNDFNLDAYAEITPTYESSNERMETENSAEFLDDEFGNDHVAD